MDKDNKIYLNFFKKFLRENKCYKAYIDNVESMHNAFRVEYGVLSIKHIFSHYKPFDWIGYAFDWEKTKQGFGFWWKLSREWQENVDVLKDETNVGVAEKV